MRVIALVDMDCFYCQVEEKLNPELQGKPVGVVQYNLWREGGIISVNYLAKDKGVTKGMWMHEAKDLCPDIQFAQVAGLRGRADLTKYREAGKQIVDVMSTFPILLERASIDEAYLDLTEAVKQELMKGIVNIPLENLKTTHIIGYEVSDFISNISSGQDTDGFCEDDLKLAIGGIIVERMRASIYEKTGYRCSAGIAQNKILAKLVCGMHKPNKQTILPGTAIPQFLSKLPLNKIKGLGGKFGKRVSEELNIQFVGELLKFTEVELIRKFDSKSGQFLYNIARGIDNEPIMPKVLSKSIGCTKRFPGKNALFKPKDVEKWINELALEVSQRLTEDQEQNNRRAKAAIVSFVQNIGGKDVNASRTFPLRSYDTNVIAQDALEIIRKCCCKPDGNYHLKYLGISVGTFEDLKSVNNIKSFFEKNYSKIKKDKVAGTTDQKVTQISKLYDPKLDKNLSRNQNESLENTVGETFPSTNKENEEIHHNEKNTKCKKNTQNIYSYFQARSINHKNTESSENTVEAINHTTLGENEEIHPSEKNTKCNKNTQKVNCYFQPRSKEEIMENLENSFFARYFSRIADGIADNSTVDARSKESDDSSDNDSEKVHEKDNFQNEFEGEIDVNDIDSNYYTLRIDENEQSFEDNTSNRPKKRKICDFRNEPADFSTFHQPKTTEVIKVCKICSEHIHVSEMQSHCDYHTAKNLERIWNAENISHDANS